jgi:hypothetical protein
MGTKHGHHPRVGSERGGDHLAPKGLAAMRTHENGLMATDRRIFAVALRDLWIR